MAAEIARLDAALPGLEASAGAAGAALRAVEASVDEELAGLAAARDGVVGRLDASMLERYERLRARFGGVAVARLDGQSLRRLPPRSVDGRAGHRQGGGVR